MVNDKDRLILLILEGALIVNGEPLSIKKIQSSLLFDFDLSSAEIKGYMSLLSDAMEGRAVELSHTASGYRLVTVGELNQYLSRLFEEPPQRLSKATIETLGLIAYKQPITRAEIEDVRGVAANSNIIKTLIERDWIKVVGRKDVPGRPALFGTTNVLLDDLNLRTIAELPALVDLDYSEVLGNPEQLDLVEHIEGMESVDEA